MRELDLSRPPLKIPVWVWMFNLVLLVVPILIGGSLVGGGDLFVWWMIPAIIILTVAHELLHAVGWHYAGGVPWSSIRFGFFWKALSPYAHCEEPMNIQPYRFAGLLPGVVTGLVPWLLAILLGSMPLVVVGSILIAGAIGDIYVLWTLRNFPQTVQVQDHPSQIGCVVHLPEEA